MLEEAGTRERITRTLTSNPLIYPGDRNDGGAAQSAALVAQVPHQFPKSRESVLEQFVLERRRLRFAIEHRVR